MAKPVVITHSGNFQTDDIFAVASLDILLNGEYELIRSRDPLIIAGGDFVVDVGGVYDPAKNRFDHHQEGGAGVRENGIPLSSFGLVWRKYGEKVAGSKEISLLIEKKLVWPVDAHDNGFPLATSKGDVFPYLIQDLLNSFVPTWNEGDVSHDEQFKKAVVIARQCLLREKAQQGAVIEAGAKIKNIYEQAEDKRLIIIDAPLPADSLGQFPEPLFVVRPDVQSTNWRVRTVRNHSFTFENRKSLPAAWAGKRNEELQQITGVKDALFCHNQLFTAGAKSKEGAVALAKIALEAKS